MVWGQHTGIDLASNDYPRRTYPGLDNGAVLRAVVDDLVLAGLDLVAGSRVPGLLEQAEGLEFVACLCQHAAKWIQVR
jgi:hypothetical protein